MSKTAFILSQSLDLSPKEVAALAVDAGLEMSAAYVSSIRSNAKRTNKNPSKLRKGGVVKVQAHSAYGKFGPNGKLADEAFIKAIADVGLVHARELLELAEERILAAIQT